MLTIHIPRSPGHVYRPGDAVGGELRPGDAAPGVGDASVELWNVEVGGRRVGGVPRAEARLEPPAGASGAIPFVVWIPLDAAPAFETRPAGEATGVLRRYWELRARHGSDADRFRIVVDPAAAGVPAEALLPPGHTPPEDTHWEPPSPAVNRRFVLVPALVWVGAVAGAASGLWGWGWAVAAALPLMAGAGIAFVFRYERRWRAAFDYGDTTVHVDRPAYRLGDRVGVTVDLAVDGPCHAFVEVREHRPEPGGRPLPAEPLWRSEDRALPPGRSRLEFPLPRDLPPSHEGATTWVVWRVHVRFSVDPRDLGGGHNPRRTLAVRA